MPADYRVTSSFRAPTWANATTNIIGMIIGLLFFISSFTYFGLTDTHGAYGALGAFYLIGGVGMIVIGIVGFVNFRNPLGFTKASYAQGLTYFAVSAIYDFILAGLYGIFNDYYSNSPYLGLMIESIIFGIVYCVLAIMMIVVIYRLSQKEDSVIGFIASLIFLIIQGVVFVLFFVNASTNAIDVLSVLLQSAMVLMAVSLLIVSKSSEFVSKKMPISSSRPNSSPNKPYKPYGSSTPVRRDVGDYNPYSKPGSLPTPEPAENRGESTRPSYSPSSQSAYSRPSSEAKPEPKPSSAVSAEEDRSKILIIYKDLLDKGVITQEEYDAKKKEVLGL